MFLRHLGWVPKAAISELKNSWGLSLFAILTMTVGLCGFLTVTSSQTQLLRILREESKKMAGADLVITSRTSLEPELLAKLDRLFPDSKRSKITEIFSMVRGKEKSRLVQIRFVEENFPFYGKVKVDGEWSSIFQGPQGYVYPELLTQLGVKSKDSLYLGNLIFQVLGTIQSDIGLSLRNLSLAPRIYLNEKLLAETGLVQKGSTLSFQYLFLTPGGISPEALAAVKKWVEPFEARVATSLEVGEDQGRVYENVSRYLALASLLSLILAASSLIFLWRNFYKRHSKSYALLMVLGASWREISSFFVLQSLILLLFSSALSIVIVIGLQPLLMGLLGPFVPATERSLAFALGSANWELYLTTFLWSFGLLVGFSLPLWWQILKQNSVEALKQNHSAFAAFQRGKLWPWMPGVALFAGLIYSQIHELRLTAMIVFGYALILLILFGLLSFSVRALTRLRLSVSLRNFLLAADRNPGSLFQWAAALSLTSFLLGVLPHLDRGLREDFSPTAGMQRPDLFLFDLQDDQIADFQGLASQGQFTIRSLSPMIRGRLVELEYQEGHGFRKSKPEGTEEYERLQRRGLNLSYRSELAPSEKLLKGKWFSNSKNSSLEMGLSIEKRFAERTGLGLGDKMKFEIEGVAFTGKVESLREVKWTSFEPNFFVLSDPEALREAPKTWISSVNVGKDSVEKVQSAIVEKLPNVSIIEVRRVMDTLLGWLKRLQTVLWVLTLLTFAAGAAGLVAIALDQVDRRRYQWALLSTLGVSLSELRRSAFWESFLVSFISGGIGVSLGVGFSYLVGVYLLDGLWSFSMAGFFGVFALIVIVASSMSWLASLLLSRRSLKSLLGENS